MERLLAHEETAKAFLEVPALEGAAKMLAEDQGVCSSWAAAWRLQNPLRCWARAGWERFTWQETPCSTAKSPSSFCRQNSTANEQAKRRLIREAKAAAKLDHPNICSIYEVAEENGANFIVMQYVEGENLASRIRQKSFEFKEALDIGVQVADALTEAHSKGIIHRDIKPQNIMLTARGQVKMLDFGLAKVIANKAVLESEAETQSLLTEPGAILGTLPYMSPEQVKGELLDVRSDIFSFGAVLYEMISGHQPFSAKTMAETISAILVSEPPPLASYSIRAPSGVERILRKCLEKDREQRFQAMAEVAADLETVRRQCESEQIESSISNATTARREAVTRRQPVEWRNLLGRRGAFALAAVVILAAVMATVLFVRRPVAPTW